MVKYLSIILLLVVTANATLVEIGSGDLPYTASSNDTITFTGTLITSATDGILFTQGADNIYIKGQGDTLVFGTGGGDDNYGVLINGAINSCYNILIDSVYILHDSAANFETTADGNWGIKTIPNIDSLRLIEVNVSASDD